MSIRKSIYLAFSQLILVPFLLLGILISYIYAVKLEKVVTESLQAVAETQMKEMENFSQHQMDELLVVGNSEVAHAALRDELDEESRQYLNDMLASRVRMTSYLENSALIDMAHNVVACSEGIDDVQAAAGLEHLIQSMDGKDFFISDVLEFTPEKGRKSVVAIACVRAEGEQLGYILAELNLDFYSSIRERTELWEGSTFYLLDGNGGIISAGTAEDERAAFVTSDEERADYNKKHDAIDFEAAPKGSCTYKVDGRDYITYYSSVPHTHWRLMLSTNLDALLSQRDFFILLAVFLLLLCGAMVLWAVPFTARRIVRPVRQASAVLQQIQARQDYSLRIPVARQDELGSLTEQVNDLLNYIETEDLYKTQQQRILEQKAGQDALTKVLNRERIDSYLQEAAARHRTAGTCLGLLFVDVDDFKDFNSQYGHSVGDQVLLFLVGLLARETQGIVGRVGGDEFLVVVEAPEVLSDLAACLERIRDLGETRFVVRGSGLTLPIHFSVGALRVDFAAPNAAALTGERLLDLADEAMYQAKNGGKHNYTIVDYTG